MSATYGQSVKVNIMDCRPEVANVRCPRIELYKGDVLIESINTWSSREYTFKKLSVGEYRIEYVTIFNKLESKTIQIVKKEKYEIDICIDYLDFATETYIPIIDQLENDQHFKIQVISTGCFHHSNEELEIAKHNDQIFLNYMDIEVKLDSAQVNLIREFEIELNYMSDNACTSVDDYILTFDSKEIKVSDGGCSWDGFYHLKNDLGLKG